MKKCVAKRQNKKNVKNVEHSCSLNETKRDNTLHSQQVLNSIVPSIVTSINDYDDRSISTPITLQLNKENRKMISFSWCTIFLFLQ